MVFAVMVFTSFTFVGYSLNSPTVPLQQYFTPIQPAPSTHQYGDPIAVSPLMELFPKRKSPVSETSKEVKGRMTLKDIEPQIPKPVGQKPDSVAASQDSAKNDHTAFDKLVSSMKAAGQLPEKPAPVVSATIGIYCFRGSIEYNANNDRFITSFIDVVFIFHPYRLVASLNTCYQSHLKGHHLRSRN